MSALKNSLAFSLALDESTDIQDNLQLVVFVCYVSSDVTVKEEKLHLVTLNKLSCGATTKMHPVHSVKWLVIGRASSRRKLAKMERTSEMWSPTRLGGQ